MDLIDGRIVGGSCKIDSHIRYAVDAAAAIVFSIDSEIFQDDVAFAVCIQDIVQSHIAFIYTDIAGTDQCDTIAAKDESIACTREGVFSRV